MMNKMNIMPPDTLFNLPFLYNTIGNMLAVIMTT